MKDNDYPESRREAILTGSTRYYGQPCKHCGNRLRHTISSVCVVCNREKVKEAKRRERDAYRAARAAKKERESIG